MVVTTTSNVSCGSSKQNVASPVAYIEDDESGREDESRILVDDINVFDLRQRGSETTCALLQALLLLPK